MFVEISARQSSIEANVEISSRFCCVFVHFGMFYVVYIMSFLLLQQYTRKSVMKTFSISFESKSNTKQSTITFDFELETTEKL